MKKIFISGVVLVLLSVMLVGFKYRGAIRSERSKLRQIVQTGSIIDLRVANADCEKIHYNASGLTIVGDLYRVDKENPACLILLHGNNKLGRKQPIIMALAKEFQDLEYMVLAIDFRGYNESMDPPKIDSIQDLDFAQDVIAGIDYLIKNTHVDIQKIYILGHSFGAGVALEVQERDKRVRKIVLYGPPRRVQEKILNPSSDMRGLLLPRFIKNMEMKDIPDIELLEASIKKRDIENYVEDFQKEGHVPIFFIDGGREEPADLQFLRHIYRKMKPPKTYWTMPGVDHYLNTGFLVGEPCYASDVLTTFVKRIDAWLQRGVQ